MLLLSLSNHGARETACGPKNYIVCGTGYLWDGMFLGWDEIVNQHQSVESGDVFHVWKHD